MGTALAYRIEYSPATEEHLRLQSARQRAIVFDAVEDPENVVTILAVGVKDRNRVLIGGEETEL